MEGPSGWNLMSSIYHQSHTDQSVSIQVHMWSLGAFSQWAAQTLQRAAPERRVTGA